MIPRLVRAVATVLAVCGHCLVDIASELREATLPPEDDEACPDFIPGWVYEMGEL